MMAESLGGPADGERENRNGNTAAGSRRRRAVAAEPDLAQRRSTRATSKRRRAEMDDDNKGGGTGRTGYSEDAPATPAPKQARGLYGRVSGLVGRAVGMLTPGRPRAPAATAETPPDGDSDDDMVEAYGTPQQEAGPTSAGAGRAGAGILSPEVRQVGSQAVATELGGSDGGDASLSVGGALSREGTSEAVAETCSAAAACASYGVAGRGAAVTTGGYAGAAPSPPASPGLSARAGTEVAAGNSGIFSPGSRSSALKGRARNRRAVAVASVAEASSSPAFRRESRDGLGFASLRGSTTGDDVNTSHIPIRAGVAGAAQPGDSTREAPGGGGAMIAQGMGVVSVNGGGGSSRSRGLDFTRTSGAGAGSSGNNGSGNPRSSTPARGPGTSSSGLGVLTLTGSARNGNGAEAGGAEAEAEQDPPFTPTELRDLVRALRFRRGLPPAASMYLLSRMESVAAARVRRQILSGHREALAAAARDVAAGGGSGGHSAALEVQGRAGGRVRLGRKGRGDALVVPVARREVAPPGAELVPSAPLRSLSLMQPPLPRGLSSGKVAAGAAAAVGGSQGLIGGRSVALGRAREPAAWGEDPDGLLTPARRARGGGGNASRDRSFAQSSPSGAVQWKPAATSTQGTPWAARSRLRNNLGGHTVVVEESPWRGERFGGTPGRRRTMGANGSGTPAAMARRIISVLEDASSPRPPLLLNLPGPSPARDSLALRSRRHDEEGPLPTRTLSVPHPTDGGGGSGGREKGPAAAVTPARLPPSRWARRSETRVEMQPPDSAAAVRAAEASRNGPSNTTPGSRKRKTSDVDTASSSGTVALTKGAAAGGPAMDVNGAGRAGKGSERTDGDGGGAAAARANTGSDNESVTAPPRTKRARTSSEGFVQLLEGRNKSGKRDSSVSTGGKLDHASPRANGASGNHRGAQAVNGYGTKKKDDGGVSAEAGGSRVATPGKGAPPPPATPGRGGETLTEEARRLEARRRGRQARSPYAYGGGRVDPNAGLPKSIRPPVFGEGAGSDAGRGGGGGGGGGGGDSVFFAPAKTPTKYWTCRGCYVRNYTVDAKVCDMCRMARNFGTPQHRNPPAVLPGGRTLYSVRAGLEAAGLAIPGQATTAAAGGKGASEGAAAPAVPGSGAFGSTATSMQPSTSKPSVTFQFSGSFAGTENGPSSDPALTATPAKDPKTVPRFGTAAPVAAAAPAATAPGPKFSFGAGSTAGDAKAPPDSMTTPAVQGAAPAATPAFTFGGAAKPAGASVAPAATITAVASGKAASASAAPSATAAPPASAAPPSFTFGGTAAAVAAAPAAPKVAAPAAADASRTAPASVPSGTPSFVFGAPSTARAAVATDAAAPGPTAKFAFGVSAPAPATTAATPALTPAASFTFGGKPADGAALAKPTAFAAPVAATAAAPTFSFGASAPAPAAPAPTATAAAGGGIASRLGPAPAPAGGGGIVAPTPSGFPGFGGGGGFGGAAGVGVTKRAASPAIGGFGVISQGPPKRGPSPAPPAFGAGGGFGGAGAQAPAPTPAAGGSAFSFGQPAGGAAGGAGFGVAGAAPQPAAQAPGSAFSFGAAAPGVLPAPAAGGFGAAARPGNFGVAAPAVPTPGGFGAAPGGFAAGGPGAAAPPAGGFSLGAANTKGRRIVKGRARGKRK